MALRPRLATGLPLSKMSRPHRASTAAWKDGSSSYRVHPSPSQSNHRSRVPPGQTQGYAKLTRLSTYPSKFALQLGLRLKTNSAGLMPEGHGVMIQGGHCVFVVPPCLPEPCLESRSALAVLLLATIPAHFAG